MGAPLSRPSDRLDPFEPRAGRPVQVSTPHSPPPLTGVPRGGRGGRCEGDASRLGRLNAGPGSRNERPEAEGRVPAGFIPPAVDIQAVERRKYR